MKKGIIFFITVIFASLICGCSSVKVTPGKDFEVIVSGDGVVIKGYKGDSVNISIPASIDDRAVTSIGYMAFYENKDIESIELPNSLLTIGDYAFSGCESLEKVKLSADNLYEIGEGAFMNCKKLESAELYANVKELPENTFSGCEALEKVSLGMSFETISKKAFYGCTSLEKIELPGNLSEIGEYSFAKCSSLGKIEIGAGVSSIAETAFMGCEKDLNFITSADSYAAEYASIHGFKRSKY